MGRHRLAGPAAVIAAAAAALSSCGLPGALGGEPDTPGWERVNARGLVLTGPVEAYQPDRLIASGSFQGRDCIVEITTAGGIRCLPETDDQRQIPSATALSSNGDVILAVEWQDMADATPPAVWAGFDLELNRESLRPGPDGDATAFVDAATSDDEATVVGTGPSAACPSGAVAAWSVLVPGLSRFGGQGPCVDATSPSQLHADTDDAWLLVAGPVYRPGTSPDTDRPIQAWVASADDERWATATWQPVGLPQPFDRVTDVVVALDGMVAGSRANRPVVATVDGRHATAVEVPDDALDRADPTVLVADPGVGGRAVVLAMQTPRGVRLWTQRQSGWYAVDGPRGHLTSAIEMEGGLTYVATRDDAGEVALWVRRRTTTETSRPAYRAQP